MYKTLLFLSIAYLFIGCDDDSASSPSSSSAADNRWIHTQMKYVYYWTDKIPSKVNYNLGSESFFESLLYKSEDRFSWIQNSVDLENRFNGISVSPGFDIQAYYFPEGSHNVICQITHVFPNSPASQAGLVRGDLFTKVNGITLTDENFYALIFSGTESPLEISLGIMSGSNYVYAGKVTVKPSLFLESPIITDSIYNFNGVKVGYFAYKSFMPDSGDDTQSYDNEIDDIFARFKSEGITSLVLDLRMNLGGAVSSCVKLSSLLVKNASSSDIFYRSRYNAQITSELLAMGESSAFETHFTDEANNISSTLNHLIVLTGDHTASASELLIYCLRPYMTVTTIGSKTYGKNVGSFTVTDESGKVKWGLQPIVVKMYNKNDLSDYSSGILPTIALEVKSNEVYPFGDIRDPLLKTALTNVVGISFTNKLMHLKSLEENALENEISNSMQYRQSDFNLSIDR